ncbi:sensor histidine kinase [Archaeoglobus profundus]|uniref:sensor histidine kinase n=1 Tax=Archaeoglobus profundus TaxID=84156 RepID=UPI00064F4B7C|nr:HAMP domain-containing sensor histidine kinase [Archaeoglobus profundus]
MREYKNAIKHGKSSRIDFRIRCLENFVEVDVIDYGKGIPNEIKVKNIRKSFSTSNSTGLGLFIVKKLVERYNGSIFVKDNSPSGTIFTIRIPKN